MGLKLAIFWGSYLWFPFAIFMALVIWRKRRWLRAVAVFGLVLSLPVAWARFVEPQLLFVETTQLDLSGERPRGRSVRIALFSDMHYGVFTNAIPLKRIMSRINSERVDAIAIAGDFTYGLEPDDLEEAVSALKLAQAPVFAVMGNHDVGFPGPFYGERLYTALRSVGVTLVENRAQIVTLQGQELIMSGASDLWQNQQSFLFSSSLPTEIPIVLLTHNPDMALYVPSDFQYDIMLSGHTHGGQIRLPVPGLTQRAIPTQHPFDTGLHVMPNGRKVFVTPGTGQVGLPMRFARPPRIDILELTLPAN